MIEEDAEYDPYALPAEEIQEPPTSLWQALRKIGPGIILAGTIVGSGELLLTTSLGAKFGFIFLWLILFSCVIKVFVQTELGRYAISSGKPTLGALNELGGPRLGAQWIVWWWLFMMLTTIFQLGAMTGTVGQSLNLAFPSVSAAIANSLSPVSSTEGKEPSPGQSIQKVDVPQKGGVGKGGPSGDSVAKDITGNESTGNQSGLAGWLAQNIRHRPEYPWALFTCLTAIVLLWSGSYKRIETITTFLVVSLTLVTVTATCALPATNFPIPWDQVGQGLLFRVPNEGLATAFGVFGITGVGAAELFYYPYWCLEKGYARYAGRNDGSDAWARRAQGWIRVMYLDAWVSMIVFTVSTVAFYFMGATVLHRQGLVPASKDMIQTLSRMFIDSFGTWTRVAFLIGAGAVLFKTLYLSSAGNARLVADFLSLSGAMKYKVAHQRARVIHWISLLIPVVALVLFLAFKEPAWMVVVGGVGQALTLPIISGAAVVFRYRKLDRRMVPSLLIDVVLWIAFVSISVVALYAAYTKTYEAVYPPESKPAVQTAPADSNRKP